MADGEAKGSAKAGESVDELDSNHLESIPPRASDAGPTSWDHQEIGDRISSDRVDLDAIVGDLIIAPPPAPPSAKSTTTPSGDARPKAVPIGRAALVKTTARELAARTTAKDAPLATGPAARPATTLPSGVASGSAKGAPARPLPGSARVRPEPGPLPPVATQVTGPPAAASRIPATRLPTKAPVKGPATSTANRAPGLASRPTDAKRAISANSTGPTAKAPAPETASEERTTAGADPTAATTSKAATHGHAAIGAAAIGIDAAAVDAAVVGASAVDASAVDAPIDAAPIDAAPIDAGPIDVGPIDAAAIDAAAIDAAAIDAAAMDGAVVDAAPMDATAIDWAAISAANVDTATTDATTSAADALTDSEELRLLDPVGFHAAEVTAEHQLLADLAPPKKGDATPEFAPHAASVRPAVAPPTPRGASTKPPTSPVTRLATRPPAPAPSAPAPLDPADWADLAQPRPSSLIPSGLPPAPLPTATKKGLGWAPVAGIALLSFGLGAFSMRMLDTRSTEPVAEHRVGESARGPSEVTPLRPGEGGPPEGAEPAPTTEVEPEPDPVAAIQPPTGAAEDGTAEDGAEDAAVEPRTRRRRGRRPLRTREPRPAGAERAPVATSPRTSSAPRGDLPARPERGDVDAAIQRVGGSIRACVPGLGGHAARIQFRFVSSGRATMAVVQAAAATPDQRSCMARAARGATVPAFSESSLVVDYPLTL